jgi:hypothetical protein
MLKTVYDTEEEIPEGYAQLYSERNGKWELTGVTGIKTQADIERVSSALVKERKDHKETREKLASFGDLDPAAAHEKIDGYDSLVEQVEALRAAGGTFDETKMEPIIQARVKQAVGPIDRQLQQSQRKLEETQKLIAAKDGEVNELKSTMTMTNIERQIRDAAVEAKVIAPAINDAILNARGVFEITEDGKTLTRDVNGVVPGLTPKEWFNDQKDKSPHWWPVSAGGGSRGGAGPGSGGRANNPWTKENWNLTKQGAVVREIGEAKAGEMAASVGSKIGATSPPSAS